MKFPNVIRMENKVFKQLIFVALLPTGALVLYGAINLALNGADPGLTLSVIGGSLLATSLLIFLIHSRIIQPLESIISTLHSEHPKIHVPYLPELSDAINSSLSKIDLNHRTKITELREESRSLITQITKLKETRTALEQKNEKLNDKSELDCKIDDSLVRLLTHHLKTIVGSTNKLESGTDTDKNSYVSEIKYAAESLLFINMEIKDQAPDRSLENIETWQLVDDVLELLAPISNGVHHTTSVRINDSCPGRLILAGDEVRAFIFQYLLYYFSSSSYSKIPVHTIVDVDFQKSKLVISVDGFSYPDISVRRAQLLNKPENSIENSLAVPAEAVASWEEPGIGLTGIVVCENHEQRDCMIHRLQTYGVTITSDFRSRELHFCMVDDESSQAFKGIRPYLSPATQLYILNSTKLYQRKNIHHIKNPLNHRQLKQLLAQLKTTMPILSRYSVLAVDDNESNLHLLELQIKELGHHVTTARNGADAIKLCEGNHFDLIFLDIQMPGVDGLEATRRIRLIPGNTPPIIGLTAHVTNEEKQAYLNAGMDQVLMKPLRINSLRSILDHHIENRGLEPIQPTPGISLATFDCDLAISKANNRAEIADELFQLLITTLPDDLGKINQAASSGVDDEFRSSVHRLNGAIRYCGVPRLANAIDRLESRIKISIDEASMEALELVNREVTSLLSWHQENPNPFKIEMSVRSS